MNILEVIAKKLNLHKHVSEKSDQHAIYASINTIENLLFAIFKIIVAAVYLSGWFFIFGVYYLIMFITRCIFLHLYTKQRINNSFYAQREYLIVGGLFYIVLGGVLSTICLYMYRFGGSQNYSKTIMLIIATLGFVKIISSIVGLVRSRNLKNPLIMYLKSLNVIDGLLAIVITQYAILSTQHAPNASTSTGIFGLVIGLIILLIGVFILIKNIKNKDLTI
ncbi:Uncharacterized protein RZ76_08530 [Apilactobacillus kunkeei]|uniref:hypothetical protein n=1 Tax=Apilactobacillus kunkeei TaxID=148814 RepID=UPI0006CE833C|nr:hypothetical protein [Apilactobacillus kunkeei]KPN82418.1 Uncharacterized protein RZ76_08530 [Apilactobacillus kunkeei]